MDLERALDGDENDAINAALSMQIEKPRQYTVHDMQQASLTPVPQKPEEFALQQSLIEKPMSASIKKKPAAKKKSTTSSRDTYSPLKTISHAPSYTTITRPAVPSHVVKKKKSSNVSPIKKRSIANMSTVYDQSIHKKTLPELIVEEPLSRPLPMRKSKSPVKKSSALRSSPSPKGKQPPAVCFDSSDTNEREREAANVSELKSVPYMRNPLVTPALAQSLNSQKLQEIATLEEEFNRIMVERG